MSDERKTKAQLIAELNVLRQRTAQLEHDRSANSEQPTRMGLSQAADVLGRVSDGFVALDNNWRYTYVNQRAAEMLNRHKPEDLIGKHIWTEYPEGVGQPFHLAYEKALAEQQTIVLEDYYQPWDRWFENRIYPSPDGLTIYFTEITDRKRAENELRKKNRALTTLSTCNQARARLADELELLNEICRICIEIGGYRLAWVGYAEQNEQKTVRPVAQNGFENGYLDTVNITWADTERGRGPTGTAIRTRQACIVRSIPDDPNYAPWRTTALQRGYVASIALPLVVDDQVLGALNIYAAEPDAFDVEEVKLLQELSSDLAYGIASLHTRAKHTRAEEALRESEEKLIRTIETIPSGLTIVASDGQIVLANPAAEQILGLTRSDIAGRAYNAPAWKIATVDGSTFPDEQLPFVRVRQTDQAVYDVQHSIEQPDGTRVILSINAAPLHDADGHPIGVVAVFNDITDRTRAEKALRESEERLRAIVDAAPFGAHLYELKPDGRLVFVGANPSADRILYVDHRQFIGKTIEEAFPPLAATEIPDAYRRAAGRGEKYEADQVDYDAEGIRGVFEVHAFQTGANRMAVFFRDITERKRVEQALQESEERYRTIFNGVRDAIFVETLSGQILDVNARACEMFGYSREEFLNKQVIDLVPPGQPVIMPNDPAGQEFLNRSVETVNLRTKGQPFPVEINGRLQTINGETCLLVVVRDITERKRAEETTRSLAKFPAENPSPVVRLNAAGIILYANEASEVLLREWNCTVGDPAPAMWRELCTQALAAQARHTLDYEYGGEVYSFVVTPIIELNYVNLYAINITVRKQAEEALRRSAQRLEILHHIDRAMLTAQSPEAIAETALLRLRDLIPFQRADVVLFDTDEMLVLATVPLTGTALHSGLKLPIEPDWIAELQRGEPIIAHDQSAFTSQRFSLQVLEAEGMQSLVNVPLLLQGQLIGALNLAANTLSAFKPEYVDIATEVADLIAVMIQQARLHEQVRHHADELEIHVAERTRELSLANERLKELDRAKDQFVSNVSHELRTPLANLKLYLSLLDQGRPDKREEYIQTLHREHGRLDKMIEDLLDLSRLDLGVTQIQPVPTDLNLLLSQLIGDRTALAAEHQLVLDYQPYNDLPLALIDPVLLTEVITNLVGNAVNYTPAGGMITVITAAREHEGQTWVTFTVQDNGLGISAKDMPHLFERFYRGEVGRKADAPGTGLGLAICKEIVDRLGSHITVESESGQGAVFTVWLKPAN